MIAAERNEAVADPDCWKANTSCRANRCDDRHRSIDHFHRCDVARSTCHRRYSLTLLQDLPPYRACDVRMLIGRWTTADEFRT